MHPAYKMGIEELYRIFTGCGAVTTDSRHCPPGSLFIALKGPTFDGNAFAAAALASGCAWAVVDNPAYARGEHTILVDNGLTTLQTLARRHRRTLATPVIAVTGTNGKTTTKELAAAVLGKKYDTLYTYGNLNNDIGVPQTLLRLRREHAAAVVEMGASHPGDIRTLVDITEPDYGLITNVGRAHLQGFGSFEGVLHTKGELYDYLRSKPQSVTFINAADNALRSISDGLPHKVYYSAGRAGGNGVGGVPGMEAAVTGRVTAQDPYLRFRWRTRLPDGRDAAYDVKTQMVGAYNIDNMLAAIIIGVRFGVDNADICDAIERYKPGNNRSQLVTTADNTLVVDAYNANPTSMAAAIDNFAVMTAANKMAILGDMAELGAASAAEHEGVIRLLVKHKINNVWLVGGEFRRVSSPFRSFADKDEVKEELARHPLKGFCILLKGSHSVGLDSLVGLL